MSVNKHKLDEKHYMNIAIETMQKSISENRVDKSSPLVGAVLVMPDGRIETAYRGEFSVGDHAEYTILERKLSAEDLSEAELFVTLEPCAPGARSETKLSCSERIVNRRIKKVWIGIEDPDPLVDGKGISYLQEHNVEVELFNREFQESIRKINADFIQSAQVRAGSYVRGAGQESSSKLEIPIMTADLKDLCDNEIIEFINKVDEFDFDFGSEEFYRVFTQLKYFAKNNGNIYPTGLGILLFGNNPQIFFHHAVIRTTFNIEGKGEDIATFTGTLPAQAKASLEWFKLNIGKQIDRSGAERETEYNYPIEVVRECIINALAHRSYDIDGASIHIEISDDVISIRSPGGPVKPIGIDRMKNLDAPFLSKNPIITYTFEKLDLSENRGLGFKTIRSLPVEYNLPLPTVSYDDPYLSFSFPRAYGNGNGKENGNGRLSELSAVEAKRFDYIRLNSPITRKEYEDKHRVSKKTAERNLTRFVELGLIKRNEAGPNTSYEIIK